MITYYLAICGIGLLDAVLFPIWHLPDAALPAAMSSALSTAGQFIGVVGQIFPVGTLLEVFAAMLAIEGAVFAYKAIRWVYQKIPGIN